MDEGKDAAIQARAYQIWQESGGAHGHDAEHWRQAEAEYGGGAESTPRQAGPADDTPNPREDGVSPFPPPGGAPRTTPS